MTQNTYSGNKTVSTRPRLNLLASCIGLALTQMVPGLALADSAVGVDMANGNAMNPPGRSSLPRQVSDDTMDTIRRSPTGQLYGQPTDHDPDKRKTDSGWEYSGGIEAGVIGGNTDTKNALYRKYKDVNNGAYLNYFEVEGDRPESATYLQAFGGGTGQKDQFYGFQYGRYNDWKLKLFYNETLHVFTDTWQSLFSGEGTGNLSLGHRPASAVISGNATVGTAGTLACTPALPCWSYNGVTYSNGTAMAAINGISGTANPSTGAITAGSPQSNIAQAINSQLAATPDSELSLVRRKGGARLEVTLTDNWKGYTSYSLEERKGARPFAMNEGNISTEIAEPIDYQTHEFLAGLQYADALTQYNLRAMASVFHNNIDTLNVQYPFLSSAGSLGALQTATYDLYPDNNAINIKGEYARSLPDLYKGRVTASLAFGTMQQDDKLQAPISAAQNADFAANGITSFGTTAQNVGYTSAALVSNWNTTAALSQQSAKQRIDTTLADLSLALRPTDDLGIKGTLRYYDVANKGGYMAYNPLTGQFGRGPADGNAGVDLIVAPGGSGCYVPPGYPAPSTTGCAFGTPAANGGNVPVFGQARSTTQVNYTLASDYDLSRTSSINLALEHEDFARTFRERDKTWEDKIKLGYVNRALGDTSLRTSVESDSKRGSAYNYRTFADLGTGLPGMDPATQLANQNASGVGQNGYASLNANLLNHYSFYFRKYDQADRDQNILNARLNTMAREDLDVGATFQAKQIRYPDSFYGMENDSQQSLTLDLNYQPSSGTSLTMFYSYQQGNKSMNMNSGVASATATCTMANLAQYGYSACSDNVNGVGGTRPLSSEWYMNTQDTNDVLGLGFQTMVGGMQLGVDYTYATSNTEIHYSYGGTALSATPATQAAAALIAGNALPNMTFIQQTINVNLLIPVSKKTTVRLFDRYEMGDVKDWHYDNVITGAVANYENGTLLLDGGPQGYRTNIVGVLVQMKL